MGTDSITNSHVESFNGHRPLLFGIAWRMLGNPADAEDILQEAFIRWQRVLEAEIRSHRAFLVTMVTRLCLNHLNLARVKKELSLGTEFALENLPSAEVNVVNDSELAEALDAAFSVVLQCLSPIERAVFLLREVFDRDYSEVARIVEKSEENCRQILRRARERIAGKKPRFQRTFEHQETMLHEFLNATTTGDIDRLSAMLTSEISLVADGENLGAASPPPIHGMQAVARFLINKTREFPLPDVDIQMSRFNEVPFLLTYTYGKLRTALALIMRAGQVQTIYLITCPVRLRSLSAQFPAPDGP
jgi:RNA polymerase sigma-70 factor, ECF subfamily